MRFLTKKIEETDAKTFICYMFEDDINKSDLFNYLDCLSQGMLNKQIYQYKTITGKFLETYKYSINENMLVVICALGKKSELTRQRFSQATANAARTVKNYTKDKTLAIELIENTNDCNRSSKYFTKKDSAQIALCALRIGLYEFNKYLAEKKETIETIELLDNNLNKEIEQGAQIGAYSSFAMKFAKDLVNESAQIVTPAYIANLAEQIAKEHKLEAKVYDKEQIKRLNMNAFLAVGQGSVNEPKFIHLTYTPKGTPRKKIALVGKGVTFDAGGMNIKPAASMLTMKSDMSGAACILGIIQAIAKMESDVELHAISALCENMTSASAYKQGDILTAMNGKTIEVDNTDAEGRITLADALSYCDKLNVDEVVDIATLTGAVIVSLGHNITGVMGNNQEQIDKFMEISKLSCENVWQMPVLDELKDNLKSEIADFKNTGGRNAGTSTAAWFLSNFTKSKSWMHLDIAGTAYLEKSNKETLSGPTAAMTRSLINYILS